MTTDVISRTKSPWGDVMGRSCRTCFNLHLQRSVPIVVNDVHDFGFVEIDAVCKWEDLPGF